MKTPDGYILLFWYMAFIFSVLGLTIYIRFNDRRIAFKKTTAFLRKKVKKSKKLISFNGLLLFIWWFAWFFAVTGLVMFILFFVFNIVDLEQL